MCGRSWKRMRRTRALAMSSSKKRFKFRGSITVPTVEVKTRLESTQAGPSARASAA